MLQNQKGASAVEFAIVLPLFVIITFGIIELSLLIHTKAVITNASREGARVGIFYEGDDYTSIQQRKDEIEEIVKDRIVDEVLYTGTEPRIINLGGPDLTPDDLKALIDVDFEGIPDKALVVTLNYPYQFFLLPDFLQSFFGGGLSDVLTISATTKMNLEELL